VGEVLTAPGPGALSGVEVQTQPVCACRGLWVKAYASGGLFDSVTIAGLMLAHDWAGGFGFVRRLVRRRQRRANGTRALYVTSDSRGRPLSARFRMKSWPPSPRWAE
jgi:hypothetical protein